jgi:hypothetical protein
MGNPLFNALGGNLPVQNPMSQLLTEAKRLEKTINGNPKEMVQELMRSGRMSQTQFNQFAQIANQLMGSPK